MNNTPTITIPLRDYLALACRGIEERACIDESLATAIRLADPNEEVSHLEPVGPDSNLSWVYPIKAWRDSAERQRKQREHSEVQRQARLAQEEKDRADIASRIKTTDAWTTYMDKVWVSFPRTTEKLGRKMVEELTKDALKGENPTWLEKLQSKDLGQSPMGT
jgi:hypothetical protein